MALREFLHQTCFRWSILFPCVISYYYTYLFLILIVPLCMYRFLGLFPTFGENLMSIAPSELYLVGGGEGGGVMKILHFSCCIWSDISLASGETLVPPESTFFWRPKNGMFVRPLILHHQREQAIFTAFIGQEFGKITSTHVDWPTVSIFEKVYAILPNCDEGGSGPTPAIH